jgi:hypothetical protein
MYCPSIIKAKMNIPAEVEVIGIVGRDKASSIGALDILIDGILGEK